MGGGVGELDIGGSSLFFSGKKGCIRLRRKVEKLPTGRSSLPSRKEGEGVSTKKDGMKKNDRLCLCCLTGQERKEKKKIKKKELCLIPPYPSSKDSRRMLKAIRLNLRREGERAVLSGEKGRKRKRNPQRGTSRCPHSDVLPRRSEEPCPVAERKKPKKER